MPLREVCSDIWSFDCTVRVVPTNGFVRRDGKNVMGAGLARQAALKYPNLPEVLGKAIREKGNHVHSIRHDIVAFPSKHNWWEQSDLDLIAQSATELLDMTNKAGWKIVAIPRVGTGNGGLRWGHVKPILEDVFGDDPRFVIVDSA